MDTKKVLKELSDSFGVCSHEKNTLEKIESILKEEYSDLNFETTGTGNLIVKFGEGSKKIAFFAHADEIGVVITKIENEHFARVEKIGGVDPRTLIAKRISFLTEKGEKIGVIGMLAPHLQKAETRGKSPSFDQLFIDFSISGGTADINVGDMGIIQTKAKDLEGNFIAGKALDNRAGCITIMKALEYLKDYKFDGSLYLAFNKGEEVGLVGAKGSAFHIQPDSAIIVDVTFANEAIPGFEMTKLEGGPAILIGAAVNRETYQKLIDIADENNIPYQVEVSPTGSGTETDIVQITECGTKTALISIPLQSMHSPVEVVSTKDIENAARLMAIYAMKEGRES